MSSNLIALQNRFLGRGESIYDRLARLREAKGALSDADLRALADETRLPPAHVRTVAKFYDELREEVPVGRRLHVCNGEPCAVAGAAAAKERLAASLAGEADVAVGDVTCLGYCGGGPNVLLRREGAPPAALSLREVAAEGELVAAIRAGRAPVLDEPTNAIHRPAAGAPSVLMDVLDPPRSDLASARTAGAYGALSRVLAGGDPEAVVRAVEASQLRGRGGAGFPAGRKLRTVREAPSRDGVKYVVLNADEGDAGAFIDKELLERAPHTVLEGMALAAYAVGAEEGYVYLRGEYPRALDVFRCALSEAAAAGLLGERILGRDFTFRVTLVPGHGAYICGEETSLLRSLEGVPAQVSPKPPYPALEGLRGAPTVVNNVETLANLPWIVARGGEAYAALGRGRSRGTKLLSLSGAVARPGLYEVELGVTLRHVLEDLAGGVPGGKRFKAVQVGGPLGGLFGPVHLDLPLTFEDLAEAGGMLGHGGVVVYDEDVDLVAIGRALVRFCAVESCGKCFPCRIGSVRATELFDRILEGRGTQADLDLLAETNETMAVGSLCALGGGIPIPIQNLLSTFIDEFARHVPGATTPAVAARKLT